MPDDYDDTIDFPDPPPAPPDPPPPPPFVPNIVNHSTDFAPRRDFPVWDGARVVETPPVAPPSLPPMHQGELRDMLHAATLHILALEARVTALEPKQGS